jgi:XRE family aerobic/anaerobic benzoate catabolism transcriptional regulator
MPTAAKLKPPSLAAPIPATDDAEFLIALGRRVRETRERRGMARKILAGEADMSERYLAQLEAGDGNSSIVLLRRVASALGVPLAELLSPVEVGRDHASRRKRVALIGLRGAGKSTLGAALARKLKTPFIELDREIEMDAGMNLAEIFNLYGQGGYRRVEHRCLEKVLRKHERAVISVGGGIVSEAETYNLLLRKCYAVWVKAAPEEHMSRVIAQGDLRPMAGNTEAMEDLRRILAAREPLYRKADLVIDTSGQDPQDSLVKLQQSLSAAASQ